jgi:hypothetical protein
MPINDGSTTPLSGFSGTITGLIQTGVEETNGARKTERVTNESNETAAVVVTGRFKEVAIAATVLTTSTADYKISEAFAYNAVNYRITAAPRVSSPTLTRINLTGRKEASMTYTPPA